MWRKIFFFLIIIVFASIMIYFFSHLKKTVTPNADALKAVPLSSAMLIEVNNFAHLWQELSTKNLMWEELKNTETFSVLHSDIQTLDSVLKTNETFKKLIENNLLYISVQMSGAMTFDYLYSIGVPAKINQEKLLEEIQSYSSTRLQSKRYDGATIYFVHFKNKQFAYTIYEDILIGSPSVILVEDAVRQMNSGVSLSQDKSFVAARKTAGKKIDVNVFIKYKNIPDLLSNYFSEKFSTDIKSFSELADWTVLDANIYPNHLLMSGFTFSENEKNYLSVFKNQRPQKPEFQEVLPANTIYLSSFIFSNFQTFMSDYTKYMEMKGKAIKQMNFFNHLEKKYKVRLFKDIYNWIDNEAGVFFTQLIGEDVSSSTYAYIKFNDIEKAEYNWTQLARKIAITDSVKVDSTVYKDYIIRSIPKRNLLKKMLGETFSPVKTPYFVCVDDFMIFANSAKSLQLYLDAYIRNYTLAKNHEYKRVFDNLSSGYNIMIYNKIYKSKSFYQYFLADKYDNDIAANEEVLEKFEAAVFQISHESNNLFFSTLYLSYNPDHHETTETFWQVNTDTTCSSSPQKFVNHYTGNKEILIQDDDNTLYLISNTGKILWKKPLKEKIMGKIHIVDAYKNKKYQLLFNTKSAIHLIDRNGHYVDNYPVQLPEKATSPLSLFDYDKNRNYRVLVFSGTQSFLYNIKGEIVKGYEAKPTQDTVIYSAKHISRNKKDYIVVIDKSGNVYIRDRRGLPRIKITRKIYPYSDYQLDGGASPEDLYILTADTSGTVYKLYFNDQLEKQTISDVHKLSQWFYDDVNNDNHKEFVYASGNTIAILDANYDILWEKEVDDASYLQISGSKASSYYYIAALDTSSEQLYIMNNQGNMYEGFPVNAITLPLITDLENDGKPNLVTLSNRSTIKTYILPTEIE